MVFNASSRVLASPRLFKLSAALGRIAQRPFVRNERLRTLPLFFAKWTATRDLPVVARRTFTERWKDLG
ncbi:MAG: hypothetical protein HY215_02180, partial [Candidatus Rokubacteria bacterium]|nr:hypothetical protein [Candidatus Rokubacteria bacterium]